MHDLAQSTAHASADQRERIVSAVIDLSVGAALQDPSVAQISSHAGVSTATFYDLFDGKEAATLAAYRVAAERLLPAPVLAIDDRGWPQALRTALQTLLQGVCNDPAAGWMLCIQARCAGPLVRRELEATLERYEHDIEALLAHTPTEGGTLDLPAVALFGALRSICSRYLRTRSEEHLPSLAEDLLAWIVSYHIPAGRERWSAKTHGNSRAVIPFPGSRVTARLPRGRHRLPAGLVARNQRARLRNATAEVMLQKGYADTTVADIVSRAGVSRDVFYQHFASKQAAFLDAQQHATAHLMEVCADAYLAGPDWPQRIWNVLEVLLGAVAAHPALANLQLIECYQAGPPARRLLEQTTRSFALFLREGYRYASPAHVPSIYSHATAGAVLEIIQRDVARGETSAIPRRLPLLAYLAIAPISGATRAVELVEQLAARETPLPERFPGPHSCASATGTFIAPSH